jgi:hypothetical protein
LSPSSNPQGGAGLEGVPEQGVKPVFVGIDVSKARLDVAIRPTGEVFSQPHVPEGIAQLVQRLQALQPRLVVLEATGGLEGTVVIALAERGLPVVVVLTANGCPTFAGARSGSPACRTHQCHRCQYAQAVSGRRGIPQSNQGF